jgi:hypothetical protein
MTLAVILVIAAVLSLVFVFYFAVGRGLQISAGATLAGQIEPLDVEAFRVLADPAETEYLHRRLPTGEFRQVQRARLLAMAAYVRVAGRNAAVLYLIGQQALASADPQTAGAALQLVNQALLLRRNAPFVLAKIYLLWAWPHSSPTTAPVLDGYRQLNGTAMLLGRLQNPANPLRISA